MKRIRSVVALLGLLAAVVMGQDAKKPSSSLLKTSLGKLPIYFIENQGVYSDEVKFYIQGADKTLFFTKDGIASMNMFFLSPLDRVLHPDEKEMRRF